MRPDFILEIARRAGLEPKRIGKDEWVIRCPRRHLHRNDDKHPSCQLNDEKGVFHCPVCALGGGMKDLAELLGVNLSDVTRAVDSAPTSTSKGTKGKPLRFKSNGPITIIMQAKIRELLNKSYTPESWVKAGVHEGTVGDLPAIAFPLPSGGWKACLYTRPDPKRGKPYTFWFTDGGKADLLVVGEAEEILLTAGEWDLLAALSSGVPCVATGMGGESTWKTDWSPRLPGKRVFIVYDVDDVGRKGAEKAARLLVDAGREVYIVRLSLSGDEAKDGKDLSDFLVLFDVSALRELLDRALGNGPYVAPATRPAPAEKSALSTEGTLQKIGEALKFIPSDADEIFKANAFKRLLPLLARLDPVARELIARTVKEKLGVGVAAIRDEIKAFKPQDGPSHDPDSSLPKPSAESLALLKDPALIERFLCDTTTLGLIGEDHNKVTLFLAMTSRLCPQPMNVVVKGESAAGKNYLVAAISGFFPPEQVVSITTLSPQSLSYWEGDLVHKILIVAEAEGADRAEYTFRVLQSEGCLTVYYVAKVGGELKTIEKTVQGPAATITTTTRESLHPENETRLVEMMLDESAEQTALITAFQAKQRVQGTDPSRTVAIVELWRGAQAALQPLPVTIPFAESIRFPSKQVRARRDFPKLLNLIEVLAFLHQFQRPRLEIRERPHIVADLQDYVLAYDLIHAFLQRVQSGLNDREATILEELNRRSTDRLSARDIAEALGWYQEAGRKRAKRCLESLHDKCRVDATESQKGAARLYWYREAPPEPDSGISTPQEIARCITDRGGHLPTTWKSPLSRSKCPT